MQVTSGAGYSRRNLVVACLGFILVYFLARLPFFLHPLVEEEGLFAKILLFTPKAPAYLLIGRVAGHEIFGPPLHPIGIYSLMNAWGWIPRHLIDPTTAGNAATWMTRLAFSIFQLPIWLGLLWLIWKRAREPGWLLILVLLLASSPLAISSSIEAQVDGSVGTLLVGLASLALLSEVPLFIFFSTLLLGFGKQEWSVGLLAAAAVALPVTFFSGKATPKAWRAVVIAVSGLLLGNALSYLWDPQDYLAGLNLISQFSKTRSILGQSFRQVLSMNRGRAHYTSFCLVAALIVSIASYFDLRRKTLKMLFLSGFSLALFGEFALSTYSTDPRYFAPSLIALSIALVGILLKLETKYLKATLAAFLILFVSGARFLHHEYSHGLSVTLIPGSPLGLFSALPDTHGADCVPIAYVGAVFNRLDFSFVGSSVGAGGQKTTAEQFGKRLCTKAELDP